MKIKIPLLISVFWLGFHNNAQDFPYVRDWGSYVGGAGMVLQDYGYDETSIQIDNQKNIYTKGVFIPVSGYNVSYYNQFVNGGGNMLSSISVNSSYFYETKFSPTGQMNKGSYVSTGSGQSINFEHLLAIDNTNNFYYIKRQNGSMPNLSTPGVWLSESFGTNTCTLSKFDSNHNLLWSTYIPDEFSNGINLIKVDANQNVYLMGDTKAEIPGVSTSNVFQEHYIDFSLSSLNASNSYIVKLNSLGQKNWGTYSVMGIQDIEIYNDGLYLFGTNNQYMPNNYITEGTFQPASPSVQIVCRFDANTGTRVWGTYYGTPTINNYTGFGIYDLEVNETGLYLSGHTTDSDYPGYFASPGAFKSQLTGDGDLFLSKLNYDGNRVWSTYFGSNGDDDIVGSPNMSILGNRIVITGNQYGNSENISTPGAFLTSASNPVFNMFFAEFDANGNRKWCSYYGGSGQSSHAEQINPKLLNDGSLILWGATAAATEIGTPGASFPTMINPGFANPFGFIAKFSLKESELATSDIDKTSDLKLYDNPNNGHFYISGSILEKQNTALKIFDSSGRLLKQLTLNKNKKHEFNLQHELSKGNYLLEINSEKGEKIKVFKMSVR